MSGKFVFELAIGEEKHRIIFPQGVGRRELRAANGTLVGRAVLGPGGLKVEFSKDALERLVESN
jgi:hypothetical protein